MKTILIYSVDPGFLEEMRSKIQELETDRLSEILLFSEKEKLEFYAAGSREAADVVIIDMDQEDDGIAIAECVLEYQKNSQIIFVSGSDEYYLDVYNVDHVYFLKKPVESRLLAQALEKAGKKLDRLHGKCLVVKNKQGIYKIELSDIIYFENEKRKIHIHTVDRKISFYGKFEGAAGQPEQRFLPLPQQLYSEYGESVRAQWKKVFMRKREEHPCEQNVLR